MYRGALFPEFRERTPRRFFQLTPTELSSFVFVLRPKDRTDFQTDRGWRIRASLEREPTHVPSGLRAHIFAGTAPMFAIFQHRPFSRAERCAALVMFALLLAGCGPPSADQALKQAFLDNPQVKPANIAPFEGTVSVDGAPPEKPGTTFLVILNDPKNPQDPHRKPKLMAGCTKDGHFDFTTNNAHDGVQVGSYVVTFVQLKDLAAPFGRTRRAGFGPPDELKNLYNDPDKNAEIPEFHVEIKAPGIKDAHFNLAIAGKEPVTDAGPHAITAIDTR
jgi:hypothetical protein